MFYAHVYSYKPFTYIFTKIFKFTRILLQESPINLAQYKGKSIFNIYKTFDVSSLDSSPVKT